MGYLGRVGWAGMTNCATTSSSDTTATSPRKIIIDTDPGVDDALALLFAMCSPELKIEAITTVAGNVPVDCAAECPAHGRNRRSS